MKRRLISAMTTGLLFLICFAMLPGCIQSQYGSGSYRTPHKTVQDYLEAGRWWGHKHWNRKPPLEPGEIDPSFVEALIARDKIDFFWIHSDLKDAFKRGYRLGYEDRTADLVLGPHLEQAAIDIGGDVATRFVDTINTFEQEWIDTLRTAIDVFIALIAEGSQADREGFIKEFTEVYTVKYNKNKEMLRAGGFMKQVSEGGTLLHIDTTKVKAILDIPTPKSLKTEIYHQTFKVMGDEMGRRYSHNLIKRDELIEWLRRSKTALQEVRGNNLGIIYASFMESYGTDGANVFRDLARTAGYKEKLVPVKLK